MTADYAKLDQNSASTPPKKGSCQRPTRRVCRCFIITMALAVIVVLSTIGLHAIGVFTYPLHAQCTVEWNFNVSCNEVAERLQNQIKKWTTADNCKQHGEKCLYKFVSFDGKELKATHETPVKHYIDGMTITIKTEPPTKPKCQATGYSRRELWYAFLDFGANYCNLRNLVDGAGLTQDPKFSEKTSDSVCTQYSSHNCDKY